MHPQVATVTDSQMISNIGGMAIGAAATIVTALYQVRPWGESKLRQPERVQLHSTPGKPQLMGISF